MTIRALRAQVQKGYLPGEYPEFSDAGQHRFRKPLQLDLGRPLVASSAL